MKKSVFALLGCLLLCSYSFAEDSEASPDEEISTNDGPSYSKEVIEIIEESLHPDSGEARPILFF